MKSIEEIIADYVAKAKIAYCVFDDFNYGCPEVCPFVVCGKDKTCVLDVVSNGLKYIADVRYAKDIKLD